MIGPFRLHKVYVFRQLEPTLTALAILPRVAYPNVLQGTTRDPLLTLQVDFQEEIKLDIHTMTVQPQSALW